jgi:glutamate synthase (NADPH/NADH) large chain
MTNRTPSMTFDHIAAAKAAATVNTSKRAVGIPPKQGLYDPPMNMMPAAWASSPI